MDRDEYLSFVKSVHNEYIREQRIRERYHPYYEKGFYHELEPLERAIRITNYIQQYCPNTDDIYNTFELKILHTIVVDTRWRLSYHNNFASEIGLLDALDNHYHEIITGLSIDDFPEEEFEMLSEIGLISPKTKIQGMIYLLKIQHKERVRVSAQLKEAEELLDSAKNAFSYKNKDTKKEPMQKKPRPWFKGLGKIAQGVAISLLDIGLAVGGVGFPVSPETRTIGAITSSTTGIGMILHGIGELRGE